MENTNHVINYMQVDVGPGHGPDGGTAHAPPAPQGPQQEEDDEGTVCPCISRLLLFSFAPWPNF